MNLVLLFLAIQLFAPSDCKAWGGRLHIDIARKAAQIVPDEMKAWRAYEYWVGFNSIQPDLWKGSDPWEDSRHYIDIELYQQFPGDHFKMISQKEFESIEQEPDAKNGILPWVIFTAQQRLTDAMATNDWVTAARWAMALAHYVGDLHQPLHLTENYNGQLTGNHGVHLRWEEAMPKLHWKTSYLSPSQNAEYIADIPTTVLAWITNTAPLKDLILQADNEASKVGDPKAEDPAYYEALWKATKDLFIEQAEKASVHLASLWYTAWINAGKPVIPPPPETIPVESIWPTVVIATPGFDAWPFITALGTIFILIIVFTLWQSKKTRK